MVRPEIVEVLEEKRNPTSILLLAPVPILVVDVLAEKLSPSLLLTSVPILLVDVTPLPILLVDALADKLVPILLVDVLDEKLPTLLEGSVVDVLDEKRSPVLAILPVPILLVGPAVVEILAEKLPILLVGPVVDVLDAKRSPVLAIVPLPILLVTPVLDAVDENLGPALLIPVLPLLLKTAGSPSNVRSSFVRVLGGLHREDSCASLRRNSSCSSIGGSQKSPSPPASLEDTVKDLWSLARKARARKLRKKEQTWYGSSDRSVVIRDRSPNVSVNKVGDGMESIVKEDDVTAERLTLIMQEKKEFWRNKHEEMRLLNWVPPKTSGLQNSAPVVAFRKAESGVIEVKLPDGQRLYRDYAGFGAARDTLIKHNVRDFRDDRQLSNTSDIADFSRSDRNSSIIHIASAPSMGEMLAKHVPHRPPQCEKAKNCNRPESPRRRVAVVQLARFTASVESEVKIVIIQPGTVAQIAVA